MSKDSPLGNIREQLDQSQKQQENDDEDAKVDQVAQEPEETEGDEGGPSFPFVEAEQSPLYPHRERWPELEDAKFEMEAYLRRQGVRDVQGRELDDAILRYVISNSEAVAELVLEARGIESDKEN